MSHSREDDKYTVVAAGLKNTASSLNNNFVEYLRDVHDAFLVEMTRNTMINNVQQDVDSNNELILYYYG